VRRLTSTLHRHVPTFVAAAVVVLLRWWTSHRREVFHIRPDEPGQLAIARFVGRGARWNMFNHSTWRPAYGTLISPITWFTDDPATQYRGALAFNALLGGLSVVLLAVVAHRFVGRSRAMAATLAAIAVLAPAVLFTTNWVWSEALVQVSFLLVVLAALRFHDTMAPRWGVALVLAAALGFGTHSRLLPLAALAAVLVLVGAFGHRLPWSRAVALLALLVVALIVVSAYSGFVVARVWDDPAATNTAGGVIGRLGHVGALGQSIVGQVWYQLVVTVGLAGLGMIALTRTALCEPSVSPSERTMQHGEPSERTMQRGEPSESPSERTMQHGEPSESPSERTMQHGEPSERTMQHGRAGRAVDARIVLGAVVPLVVLSIVFMTDRWRPDQIVYGRYNDAVMAPIVVAGLAAVVTSSRRRLLVDGLAVIATTAVCGIVLRLTSDDELRAQALLRPMVLGLVGYVRTARLVVLDVTASAVMVMAVALTVVLVSRRRGVRRAVAVAVVAALLVAGYRRAQPVIDASLNSWASAGAVESVRGAVLPPGAAVRARFVDDSSVKVGVQRLRTAVYEFYLPENPIYVEGEVPRGVQTPFVFAPVDDVELRRSGGEVVWRDPDLAMGLWVQPESG
jgi:hypothetical protein